MDEKHINEQLDALRHDTNKNDGKRYLINKGGAWMIGTEMEHPVFNRVIGVRGQMYPYRTLTSIIPLAQAIRAPQLETSLRNLLSIIHGDGGHTTEGIGLDESINKAIDVRNQQIIKIETLQDQVKQLVYALSVMLYNLPMDMLNDKGIVGPAYAALSATKDDA